MENRKQGFHDEKHHGYGLSHTYSYKENAVHDIKNITPFYVVVGTLPKRGV